MSKRRLLELVEEKHVTGWDDPRMPTLAGLRRRGYTPEAIRNFCHSVGIAKSDNTVEMGQLEYFIRDDLNQKGAAGAGGGTSAQGGHHQLSGGSWWRSWRRPTIPTTCPGKGRAPCPSPGSSTSSGTTFSKSLPGVTTGWRRGARCGCATAYIIRCDEVVKDPATGVGAGTALLLRPGDPQRLRHQRQEGPGDDSMGVRRPRPRSRAPALRPACSRWRTPRGRRTGDYRRTAESQVPGDCQGPRGAEPRHLRDPATGSSSSGWDTFAWTRTPPRTRSSSIASSRSGTLGSRLVKRERR